MKYALQQCLSGKLGSFGKQKPAQHASAKDSFVTAEDRKVIGYLSGSIVRWIKKKVLFRGRPVSYANRLYMSEFW